MITAQRNWKNLVGKFMDINDFHQFMQNLKWEIQKYALNQQLNNKTIDNRSVITIISIINKQQDKFIKKYFTNRKTNSETVNDHDS